MRYVAVLLMILLLPEGAMAARWEKAEVPVWDFTPDRMATLRPGKRCGFQCEHAA
jgi:hypothetical protein